MNTHRHTETSCEMATYSEITLHEKDLLTQWGFAPQEITSLLWLRQRYQTGGSDRASIVRHLKFLSMLVKNGDLEL